MNTQGLSSDEARRRLSNVGRNELQREQATPWWKVFGGQFKGALIWLLVGACVISAAVGEVADAIAIGAILVINACIGFVQEFRAERAILALRSMTAPHARVLRDGKLLVLPAAEVVPGDVLALEAGDVVAADARLLEAHDLSTMEAALTGESAPVSKQVGSSPEGAPLAERHDFVFMGTAVATGTARAEVCGTGMATELGRIANLLATAEQQQTPLQHQLERVGRKLLVLCAGLVVLVALISALRGAPALEVMLGAVSLAVAAVPEGLAAIVTIALAIGVRRMAERNVLVRRLPAVETLGSATVICTDKTGTLTTGVMAVREVWGKDHAEVLYAAAANCDAELSADGKGGIGDPTELAILAEAAQRGVLAAAIDAERPRVNAHPFDADRKRMSTFRADGKLYLKGAVESVLSIAREKDEAVRRAAEEMASRGLRVLAVAIGPRDAEQDVEVKGLVGIADPPRTEAIDAVVKARAAGIRTVMITGDHPRTAEAIARELGILKPGESAAERVHARATPEDKLRIVRAWKAKGAVVAMTGDGVNDAPALKEAHIGIAMGRTGTEVTREASDMVLTDDNFASIVAAVREGRGIFDNIRKTLVYLLAGNMSELLVMLGAVALGLPLPLLPLQLLWINLVTDGLPALALVMDPPPSDALERAPRAPGAPMLWRREWWTVLAIGVVESVLVLSVFAWALKNRDELEARNLAFSVLVFAEVLRAFAARSDRQLFWEVGPLTNLKLVAVVAATVFAQLALHHLPVAQQLFQIGPISMSDCALSFVLGLVPVTLIELSKLLRRALPAHPRPAEDAP